MSALVAFGVAEKVPCAQGVQDVAPTSEKVPAGQPRQAPAPLFWALEGRGFYNFEVGLVERRMLYTSSKHHYLNPAEERAWKWWKEQIWRHKSSYFGRHLTLYFYFLTL